MLLNIFFDALIPNHSVLMELFILVKVEQVFVNQKHVFIFWIAHLYIHTVTILSFVLNRSKRRSVDYGLFSTQSHIETCVDSSDLNYPDQCRPSLFFLLSISIDPLITVKYVTVNWTRESFVWTLSPTLIGFTFITRFFFFLAQSWCRSNQFRTPVFCDNFDNLLENQQQTCKQTYIPVNKQLKIWTSPFSCLVQDKNSN